MNQLYSLLICLIPVWDNAFAGHVQTSVTEMTTSGDFDGDGREDLVMLDRATGQYRIAFGEADGSFFWSQVRTTGVTTVSAMAVGRLLSTAADALAVTSPELNGIAVLAADSRNQAGIPEKIAIDAIGPNTLLAIDIGGSGNTTHDDLLVASLWNDLPDHARINMIRADGTFSDHGFANHDTVERAERHALKIDSAPLALMMERGNSEDTLLVYDTSAGFPLPAPMLRISALAAGSEYALGYFDSNGMAQILVWLPGDNRLTAYPLSEPSPGQFVAGPATVFVLDQVIDALVVIPGNSAADKLLVQHESRFASIYDFDGSIAPVSLQSFSPNEGNVFTAMVSLTDGRLVLMSGTESSALSSQALVYRNSGTGYDLDASHTWRPIFPGAAPASLLLFENEPFVNVDPGLVRAVNIGQWSTAVDFSGGNVSVTNETYVDPATGLANPTTTFMGSKLPWENHALVSQYRTHIAVAGFNRAGGLIGLAASAAPASGTYTKVVEVSLVSSDPTASIYFRTNHGDSWQLYQPPLYVFADTDIWFFARQGAHASTVEHLSYRFSKAGGDLDSDNDGVPDYVEIAHGLHPIQSGADSDGDGFSDLEELVLGSDPGNANSKPNDWPNGASSRPSLEQQTAFNIQITAKPLDGTTGAITTCVNGENMYAYDPSGRQLARARVGDPPSKRSELKLWLRVDQLDQDEGRTLSSLKDATGNHVLRPLSGEVTLTKNGPAGLPALSFDGQSRWATDDLELANDFTLLAVFREPEGGLPNATLLDGALRVSRSSGHLWGLNTGEGKRAIQGPFPAGQTHLLVIQARNGRLTLSRNGRVIGTARIAQEQPVGPLVLGGALNGQAPFLRGELSELMIYAGIPEQHVYQRAHAYLAAKYLKMDSPAHLNNVVTESPFVVIASEAHYRINTNNHDSLIGREMVAALASPPRPATVVNYQYAYGTLTQEAANWVSAAVTAYSNGTRTTVTDDLELIDCLAFLLFEAKLGRILAARGDIDDHHISLTPWRTGDINRIGLTAEQIASVERRAPGHDNGYKLSALLGDLKTELETSSDPDVALLQSLVHAVYGISSQHHNTPPQKYRLPLDALRDFIADGKLDTAYANQTGWTHAQLSSALQAANQVQAKLDGREVSTFSLTVTATSFEGTCTVLDSHGVAYSLFDHEGKPYNLLQAEGLNLIPGLRFNVTAYTDSDAQPCAEEQVLEVISTTLVGLVYPTGKTAPDPPDKREKEQPLYSLTLTQPQKPGQDQEQENSPVPEEEVWVTRWEASGDLGIDTQGTWWIEDETLVAEGGRARVDFLLHPDMPDLYRLELELRGDQDEAGRFGLRLWLDDIFLGSHQVEAGFQQAGFLQMLTPYLNAGTHRLSILWDDLPGADPLIVAAVRLQERLGADSDGDGIKNWVVDDLSEAYFVDRSPMVSAVSPAVIEGFGRFPETIRVNNDLKAKHGLQGRWYCRVPLSVDEPTPMRVDMAHGALSEYGAIEWISTNVLQGGEVLLGAGDALRLNAGPEGQQAGSYQMRIGTQVMRGKVDQPLVWRFSEPGLYTVSAAHYTPGGKVRKGTLRVRVAPAQLPDAAIWVGNARNWDLPGLPEEVALEADEDLELRPVAYLPEGGMRTELFGELAETRHVVARLGEQGPLLDVARIDGFDVFTANDTYVVRVKQHDDGSESIAIGLVVWPLPEDTELRLTIIAGGVSFEDGTISKTLSRDQFDSLGRAEVRFNRVAGAQTAVCHITEGYQNHIFIGTVGQLREERE